MNKYIPTPTVGEIITEEFMKPLNISEDTLSNELGLPEKYTRAILKGDIKITPELSGKLSAYFGMSEPFFFKIQNDIDSRNAKLVPSREVAHELAFA